MTRNLETVEKATIRTLDQAINTRTENHPGLSFRTKAILKAYRAKIKKWECSCGTSFKGGWIRFYPHPDGWDIGEGKRQWLFIRCLNPECMIDHALWKLGVPR